MEQITLQLEPRTVTGKKVRRLRTEGVVPVHVYGPGIASLSAQAATPDLLRTLAQAGHTTPVNLEVRDYQPTDGPLMAFVREVQQHPTTGALLHVDFLRVEMKELMTGDVPITLVGEAPAVRLLSGMLAQVMHSISVECLPLDMPHQVQVDVSGLESFEAAILVKDLQLPAAVTVLNDLEALVVRVNPPRLVVEEEVAEVEGAVAEETAAETAEGEDEKEA